MSKLKIWWENNGVPDILSIAATITTFLTFIYYFFFLINRIIGWLLAATGLVWPIRLWVWGSVLFTAWLIWGELVRFRADPENYSFAEENPPDENETGVE